MDTSVMITLGFLVFAIVMFAWEKIPLSITAMIVAVGLHLSGVLSGKDAFAGFVDPNVLLFMGMFVIGAAFFETIIKMVIVGAFAFGGIKLGRYLRKRKDDKEANA